METIRNLRKRNGVSQIDLAMGSGVSRFRLYMIEKGYAVATEKEVLKIKKFLKGGQNAKSRK